MKNKLILGFAILAFSSLAWSSNFQFSTGVGSWAVGKAAKAAAKRSNKSAKKPPSETGGPVVKTGPTRGQNRSRNQDGTWRKKRSDAKK